MQKSGELTWSREKRILGKKALEKRGVVEQCHENMQKTLLSGASVFLHHTTLHCSVGFEAIVAQHGIKLTSDATLANLIVCDVPSADAPAHIVGASVLNGAAWCDSAFIFSDAGTWISKKPLSRSSMYLWSSRCLNDATLSLWPMWEAEQFFNTPSVKKPQTKQGLFEV